MHIHVIDYVLSCFGEAKKLLRPSWKKAPRSSYPRAQHSRWASIVRLCVVWLAFTSGTVSADDGIGSQTFTFDIPSQSADSALTEFAEQADLTLVFPDAMVRDRTANALVGEYSLEEGAAILLEGTGLIPSFSNPIVLNITIDDTSSSGEKAVNATKKAGLLAIIAGALSGGVDAQEPTVTETEIQTSVVTGTVTDARTGANLRGAKVTIEETGQWTSTGDLGRFRFIGVPIGEVTVTVSFLGYAGQSSVLIVGDEVLSQNFALRGGSEIEEIVVFGQRSARAQTLNQERTAPNVSTVVSSDQLGQFNGTTISEVLRKAAGVAFVEDPATGDGANIIVRGVDPDLNAVRLNGIELPETSGTGRSADLSNILAESIDSVTISKTLLPSQDTSSTGGLVEIETKSPFDRDDRFASLFAETSFSDENLATETQLSGVVSGTFGEKENIGLSASVQYRTTERDNFGYLLGVYDGAWLPLQVDGSTTITSIRQVNPDLGFPFESGADQYYVSRAANTRNIVEFDNLGVSITGAWEPNDATSLRVDYQLFEQEMTTTNALSGVSSFGFYMPQPVQALDGETRAAIFDFGFLDFQQSVNWVPNNKTETQVISFRGETVLDRFNFGYSAGYTVGRTPRTETITLDSGATLFGSADVLTDEAVDPIEGRIITPFGVRTGDGFLNLPLNDTGQQFFADPGSYTLRSVQSSVQTGENSRFDVGFSTRYDINIGPWEYFEAGVQFEQSEFSSTRLSLSNAFPFLPASDFPLALNDTSFAVVGIEQSLPFYDIGTAVEFLDSAFDGGLADIPINESTVDDLTRQKLTTEDEFAYYFETKLQFGDFDLIGGVRFSDYTIEANTVASTNVRDENDTLIQPLSDELDVLVQQEEKQLEILPRFQLNYRPTDQWVARFGYFKSAARPLIENLNDRQIISLELNPRFGPDSNLPILGVLSGNPTLKPPSTDNFDLSVEYYFSNVGVVKVGAFYKSIDNFIQDVVSSTTIGADEVSDFVQLPDNEEFVSLLPDELFIQETIPTNSDETAVIWGVEFAVERQLTELPGSWGGLGVFGNYTYTDSSRTTLVEWTASPILDDAGNLVGTEPVTVEIDDVRFNQQPRQSGTLGITYNMYSFDGIISYTYQDRRQTTFRRSDLSSFSEPIDSLDLRIEYRPTADRKSWIFFVEGSDLLDSASEPSFETSRGGINQAPRIITSASYFGGRQLRFGVRKTF